MSALHRCRCCCSLLPVTSCHAEQMMFCWLVWLQGCPTIRGCQALCKAAEPRAAVCGSHAIELTVLPPAFSVGYCQGPRPVHTTLARAALLPLTRIFARFASLRERKALRKKMGLDEDEEAEAEDPGGWLCCLAVVKGSCRVASGGAKD